MQRHFNEIRHAASVTKHINYILKGLNRNRESRTNDIDDDKQIYFECKFLISLLSRTHVQYT